MACAGLGGRGRRLCPSGRKAQLTPTGQVLYQRAKTLLERAGAIERSAASFSDGWEPEIRIAVEITFPTWLLLQSLARFAAERPEIRVQLHETVLGGRDEELSDRRVDLAIAGHIPRGLAGDPLPPVRFIAAAHPAHPLHHLGRPATLEDLREHRQLIVHDTARERPREGGEPFEHLYLVVADPEQPGKAAARLAEILREETRHACAAHGF